MRRVASAVKNVVFPMVGIPLIKQKGQGDV